MIPDNYQVNAIPFESYTPTIDNTVILTDDEVSAALPIGFTFNFSETLIHSFILVQMD